MNRGSGKRKKDINYWTADELGSLMKNEQNSNRKTIQVVDVRDDDYVGGHVPGCINLQFNSFWSTRLNIWNKGWEKRISRGRQRGFNILEELAEKISNKEFIVFHCMFSVTRGPASARAYQNMLTVTKSKSINKKQKVLVLEGGFDMWRKTKQLVEGDNASLFKRSLKLESKRRPEDAKIANSSTYAEVAETKSEELKID